MNRHATPFQDAMRFSQNFVNADHMFKNVGTKYNIELLIVRRYVFAVIVLNGIDSGLFVTAAGQINGQDVITESSQVFCLLTRAGTQFQDATQFPTS